MGTVAPKGAGFAGSMRSNQLRPPAPSASGQPAPRSHSPPHFHSKIEEKGRRMSEFIETNIIGKKTQVIVPEEAEAAPITDYGIYDAIILETEFEFDRCQDEFFQIPLNDKRILDAAKEWEEAGITLLGYALSLFNSSKGDKAKQDYANILIDRVTKAAGLRRNNIAQHRRLMLEQKPEDAERKKLFKSLMHADHVLQRSYNTQVRYRDLYEKSQVLNNSKQEELVRESWKAAQERKLIPDDVIHIPGKIYPPIPIPAGERVVEPPLAYQLMKAQPAEAKIYDRELDELVLKPGYVSPDGLVDDQSVIRDREKGEVIMKLRGGEPVIWKEWKAKSTSDVPDPDSWMVEYNIRLYNQIEQDKHINVYEPWPYEFDDMSYQVVVEAADEVAEESEPDPDPPMDDTPSDE